MKPDNTKTEEVTYSVADGYHTFTYNDMLGGGETLLEALKSLIFCIESQKNPKIYALQSALDAEREKLEEITRIMDQSGMPIGTEHKTYSIVERVSHLSISQKYWFNQTDKEREKVKELENRDAISGEFMEKSRHFTEMIEQENRELIIRSDKAEAAAAQMRGFIQYVHDMDLAEIAFRGDAFHDKIDKCLSSSCGIGWASPEEVEALVEALRMAQRWMYSPYDSLNQWEDIAQWFHQDTGMLRPGKDQAAGGSRHTHEERVSAFDAWCDKKAKMIHEKIEEALEAFKQSQ